MTSPDFETFQKIVIGDMQQVFTPKVVEHAMNPRNVGSIDNANGFALMQSDCGENMEIWLRIKDEHIEDICFWSDGCGATIACGSMISELAQRKTVEAALRIDENDIINAFDGLPEGNVHCAELAVNTLREAVKGYLQIYESKGKNPAKRGGEACHL